MGSVQNLRPRAFGIPPEKSTPVPHNLLHDPPGDFRLFILMRLEMLLKLRFNQALERDISWVAHVILSRLEDKIVQSYEQSKI
mmetsp:Transcript_20428/g.21877  ORF Transcript_20428/g.21877 Transcript_20428/m.21877 type:complete len:83 (+) Transcript_20428:980-1228(+)